MTGVLTLVGVTAGYGRTTVLRDIDLSIEPGTIAALLGPNGAGKTTLLKVAAGVISPSAGTITVLGDDVTKASPHKRARKGVCLIPEGRGVFPRLTVRENLLLHTPPWIKKAETERVLEAFPILRDKLGDRAGSMSGGQQQMLALARAYLSDPKVVLLDEVSMGLAPKVVEEIFQTLERLAATGVTLLLVEQFVTRALAMSDSVHLLNRGRLTFSGKPAELDEDEVLAGYFGTDLATAPDPTVAAKHEMTSTTTTGNEPSVG